VIVGFEEDTADIRDILGDISFLETARGVDDGSPAATEVLTMMPHVRVTPSDLLDLATALATWASSMAPEYVPFEAAMLTAPSKSLFMW
jgi:hypothetical protein